MDATRMGCFLVVVLLIFAMALGIIIDAKCWWDDIPVLDLHVKEDATCR
jgi:hypothetical protein